MKKSPLAALFSLPFIFALAVLPAGCDSEKKGAQTPKGNPMVVMQTSMGDITIELFADKAPQTAENFAQYVKDKFFDGTIFHRVIPNFVIQGGGFTPSMEQKQTRAPIQNEADNGLKNSVGSLSMARTSDPHSASSQFFINLKDNAFLDHKGKTPQGWGYAVFGKVTEGMDVVEKIAAVQTGNKGGHQDVPNDPIVVKKAFVK